MIKTTKTLSPLFTLVAASAFGLTLGLSACATTQTVSDQHEDNVTNMAVANRLTTDPDVARADIDVDTLDGVVTLRGEVESANAWFAAENVAERTDGVKEVRNRLVIVKDNKVIEADGDGVLSARVKTRINRDPDVKGRNIDVDAQNADVTLSGIVESKEARNEAVMIALETEGVRTVVSELTVGDTVR